MMTLSTGFDALEGEKAPHCYHLVTIKSASRVRLFAANGANRSANAAPFGDRSFGYDVLDLFS
jgi:hypothetical protein